MLDKDFDKIFKDKLKQVQSFNNKEVDWKHLSMTLKQRRFASLRSDWYKYSSAAVILLLILFSAYLYIKLERSESALKAVKKVLNKKEPENVDKQISKLGEKTIINKKVLSNKETENTKNTVEKTISLKKTKKDIIKTEPISKNRLTVSSTKLLSIKTANNSSKPIAQKKPKVLPTNKTVRKWSIPTPKNITVSKKYPDNTMSGSNSPTIKKSAISEHKSNMTFQKKKRKIKKVAKLPKYRNSIDYVMTPVNANAFEALEADENWINNERFIIPKPRSYNVGITIGGGISPFEFASDTSEIVSGGYQTGVRGEISYGNFRIYGETEYLRTTAFSDEGINNLRVPPFEPPGENLTLQSVWSTQDFMEFGLGIRYVFTSDSSPAAPYIGSSFRSQVSLKQKYKYIYVDPQGEEIPDKERRETRNVFTPYTVNLNAGVEFDIARDFTLQVEGFYNMKFKNYENLLPDMLGLKVVFLYNI